MRDPAMSDSPATDVVSRPLCVILQGGLVPNRLGTEETLSHPSRSRSGIEPEQLPYHPSILEAAGEARRVGRRVVLVSLGEAEQAKRIADHLGLFDEILVPDARDAEALAAALRRRFGSTRVDLMADRRTCSRLSPSKDVRTIPIESRVPSRLRAVVAALRAHQWLKNALVFLPALAGQRLTDGSTVLGASLAFVAFCFVASSVYVLNDIVDLAQDRKHPSKRRRPFASGDLPLAVAPVLSAATLGSGLLVATTLVSGTFAAVLSGYFVLALAYTLKLKGAVLIDVLTLALLYTLRVLGGSAATGITPSVWLLGFALFFFLSLAMVKRYAELHRTMERGGDVGEWQLPGRSYQARDLPVLIAMGVGTGCMAVLVLAFYVISDEFARHYRHPWLLWQLCPLALYWIGRAWIVVARDEMDDDPLIWSVKDQMSRWVGVLALLILLLAR